MPFAQVFIASGAEQPPASLDWTSPGVVPSVRDEGHASSSIAIAIDSNSMEPAGFVELDRIHRIELLSNQNANPRVTSRGRSPCPRTQPVHGSELSQRILSRVTTQNGDDEARQAASRRVRRGGRAASARVQEDQESRAG